MLFLQSSQQHLFYFILSQYSLSAIFFNEKLFDFNFRRREINKALLMYEVYSRYYVRYFFDYFFATSVFAIVGLIENQLFISIQIRYHWYDQILIWTTKRSQNINNSESTCSRTGCAPAVLTLFIYINTINLLQDQGLYKHIHPSHVLN